MSSRVILFLNIALAALLAWGAVSLLSSDQPAALQEPREIAAAALPPGGGRSVEAPEAAIFESLAARDIFGKPQVAAPPEPAVQTVRQVEAPKPLSLKLLGTIAGDTILARAIIEDISAKRQEVYKVGDEVQGARISGIQRNRVTLDRGGRQYVIGLDHTDAVPVSTQPALATMAGHAHDVLRFITSREIEVDREAAFEAIGGVESILSVVQITPHVADGKTVGLKLSGIDQIPLAQFAGFQEGDVVQNVNGQDLTSINKAIQVMRKAQHMPQIDVTILRGDTTHTFNFGFK